MAEAKKVLNQVITPSEKAVTKKESVLGQLKNVLNLDVKSSLTTKCSVLEDNLNVANQRTGQFTNTVAPLTSSGFIKLPDMIKVAKQSKDKKVSVALFVKNHQQWIVIASTREKALNLQQLLIATAIQQPWPWPKEFARFLPVIPGSMKSALTTTATSIIPHSQLLAGRFKHLNRSPVPNWRLFVFSNVQRWGSAVNPLPLC